MTPSRTDDLRITRFDSFEEARAAWERFEQRADLYVVQTHPWLAHWYECVGRSLGVRPHLVQVERADGTPLLFLPLGTLRKKGATCLTWLGGELCDYHAPLLGHGWDDSAPPFAEVWQRVLAVLPPFNATHLEKQPELIGGRRNPLLDLPGAEPHDVNPYCQIEGDWASFYRQRVDARHRADSRRKVRRLEEMGSLRFREIADREEARLVVERMIRQKSSRYLSTHLYDLFRDRRYRKFFLDPSPTLWDRGYIQVTALQLDSELLAVHWGMVFRGRLYYFMASFDGGRWSRYSPGRLMLERLFEWCFGEKIEVLDFTIGGEAFKWVWSNRQQNLYQHLIAHDALGSAYVAIERMKKGIRQRVRLHRVVNRVRNLDLTRSARIAPGPETRIRVSAGLAAETLSYDEFCRLERPWNELVLASPLPLPFLSHAWIRLWWEHFGKGQEFAASVVRDGDRLVAGVPIAVRRSRAAGLPLSIGEIVGTGPVVTRGMGLSDKADLVVRSDSPSARPRLVDHVLRLLDSVDVLDIKGLDESSPVTASLRTLAPRPASLRCLRRSVSPYLELPRSWDEYLRSRSANFRKHLKKYRRLLEQQGAVEVVRLEHEGDTARLMAEVSEINHWSWKAEHGTNLFRSPTIHAFFLDVVREMTRAGWIDLHVLRVAGRPAAHELNFDFGGRVFSYNSAYRKEFARFSPGTALTALVVERACARGRTEYDMLRGDEEYKLRWSPERRFESQLLVPADRVRARTRAYLALYVKARLKQWRWLETLDDRAAGMLNRMRFPG